MSAIRAENWSRILVSVGEQLSEEERRIAKELADGKTMREVGSLLGQHRSSIWRTSKRIRARVKA